MGVSFQSPTPDFSTLVVRVSPPEVYTFPHSGQMSVWSVTLWLITLRPSCYHNHQAQSAQKLNHLSPPGRPRGELEYPLVKEAHQEDASHRSKHGIRAFHSGSQVGSVHIM